MASSEHTRTDFQGLRILITGGSSGIGLAAAGAFLGSGATVVILGRDREKLKSAISGLLEFPERGGATSANAELRDRLHSISADVSIPDDCRRSVDETIGICGGLDVLVNSAGIYTEGASAEVDEQTWISVMDTNLKGTFFMCRHAIPELEKSRGCIVNVASDSGLTGNNRAAVYCASKGGVVLLTRSLAVELACCGVRVNAVCPGIVDTPMLDADFEKSGFKVREEYDRRNLKPYPPGTTRYVSPDEVARSVLFLASPQQAGAITGVCLPVDQGLTAGY